MQLNNPKNSLLCMFKLLIPLGKKREDNSHVVKLQAYRSTTQAKQIKLEMDEEGAALPSQIFVYLGQCNK